MVALLLVDEKRARPSIGRAFHQPAARAEAVVYPWQDQRGQRRFHHVGANVGRKIDVSGFLLFCASSEWLKSLVGRKVSPTSRFLPHILRVCFALFSSDSY